MISKFIKASNLNQFNVHVRNFKHKLIFVLNYYKFLYTGNNPLTRMYEIINELKFDLIELKSCDLIIIINNNRPLNE